MANRRVHELAKELGIKSKAIVDKCLAEGLSAIKGHQSTVSAGLEATIREWFSQGTEHNTVETADKVNLEEVRIKQAPKPAHTASAPVAVPDEKPKRKSPREVLEEEQGISETSELDAVAAEPAVEIETSTAVEADFAPEPQPTPETPAVEVKPAAEVKPEPQPQPAPVREELESPVIRKINVIKPGTQVKVQAVEFKPAPAKLSGPQVIRTERPDFVPTPRRKPARDDAEYNNNRPAANAAPGDQQQTGDDSRNKVKGKKGSRKVTLTTEDTSTAAKGKKGKNARRSRIGSEGGGDFRVQDLRERDERLARASGMGVHRIEKQIRRGRSFNKGSKNSIPKIKIEKATVKEPITVKDLSAAIGVRSAEIIGKLMGLGVMATINEVISSEVAESVALDFEVELTIEQTKTNFELLVEEFDKRNEEAEKRPRPPVVAFLGHVDHGKTSLLDYIRKAQVTDSEAGGITQHIGSYLYDDGQRRVAFLDTPGHKAFTEMRARGANMTDIVVLVVAADDGIMPQTEEAIAHAKAAGVPIIVALNKIDLPTADPMKVYGQLAEHELVPAEWGGDTEVIQTSATTGKGMDELVEHLDLISELNDLKAANEGPATGWIVESEMSVQTGVVARMLVKEGMLNPGDIVVSGSSYGRVRTLVDATGKSLDKAGPATPVVITGLDVVPVAGDRFFVIDNMTRAAEIASEQKQQRRERTLASKRKITLENLFTEIAAGEVKELNVVIKADVQGSVDVLCKSITELNTSEVAVKVLHAAVGGITESDVLLAEASNAIIIGFQVVADDRARSLAEKNSVEIRNYRIIYKIVDDIKAALEGMLTPDIEIKVLGKVEVRQIFRISRIGVVAGCYVQEGIINRNAKVRIVRDSVVIRDENAIETLRREKDDSTEVRAGLECGLKLAGYDDLKSGDIIEVYEEIKVSRSLESSH